MFLLNKEIKMKKLFAVGIENLKNQRYHTS